MMKKYSPPQIKINEVTSAEKRGNGFHYDNNGYKYIKIPNHPNANNKGNVFEHRLIVESMLGRYLENEEEVHHIDGDRLNNRVDNVTSLRSEEHKWWHGVKSRMDWEMKYGNRDIFLFENTEMFGKDISKELNVSKSAVNKYLKRKGYKPKSQRKKMVEESDIKLAEKMKTEGKSLAETGLELGVSAETVRRRLRDGVWL